MKIDLHFRLNVLVAFDHYILEGVSKALQIASPVEYTQILITDDKDIAGNILRHELNIEPSHRIIILVSEQLFEDVDEKIIVSTPQNIGCRLLTALGR